MYANITHATPSSEILSTCRSLNFAATRRVVKICVKMAHRPTHAKKLPMRASLKLKRLIRNSPKNEMKNPKPALKKNDVRKSYILRALQSLPVIWTTLAAVIILVIGLYSILRVAGVDRNQDLLIAFIVSLALIFLALWLLPGSFLTLKEEKKDDKSDP